MSCTSATVFDYHLDGGAIPDDESEATCWMNGRALNASLAKLRPGDALVVAAGQTYHLMGGIKASDLVNVTLQLDGQLVYSTAIDAWPREADGSVLECMELTNVTGLVLTSTAGPHVTADWESPEPVGTEGGLLDGRGGRWWGVPGIGCVLRCAATAAAAPAPAPAPAPPAPPAPAHSLPPPPSHTHPPLPPGTSTAARTARASYRWSRARTFLLRTSTSRTRPTGPSGRTR